MANLEESAVWTPGVYQLETTDPVLGGPVQPAPATGGIANRAALALANRTAYLKSGLESTNQALNDGLQNAAQALTSGLQGAADALAQTDTALQAQIALKANLDSPALTGSPSAPTPAPADDSNRLATTAYVTTAIATSSLAAYSIAALPSADIGPVLVIEACEFWIWVHTPYFTGYRSPLCGRPVDGHTNQPLPSEVDATGGLLPKAAYARLWAYAQENDLIIAQDTWNNNVGAHRFVDVSSTQFRVPDLRNQFRRYSGTDADSGQPRGLGSRRLDTLKSHNHAVPGSGHHDGNENLLTYLGKNQGGQKTGSTGGAETAPRNVAYHPRIHA